MSLPDADENSWLSKLSKDFMGLPSPTKSALSGNAQPGVPVSADAEIEEAARDLLKPVRKWIDSLDGAKQYLIVSLELDRTSKRGSQDSRDGEYAINFTYGEERIRCDLVAEKLNGNGNMLFSLSVNHHDFGFAAASINKRNKDALLSLMKNNIKVAKLLNLG